MGIARTGKTKKQGSHEFEEQKKEHQAYMEEQRVKRGPLWKRLTTFTTPFLVPTSQTVDLFFFHRAFKRIRGETGEEAFSQILDGDAEVPLVDFQRAMIRFFRAIRVNQEFDVQKYDKNDNGHISWGEFCKFWQDRDVCVRFSFCERLFLTLEDPERSILGKMMSVLVFFTIVLSTSSFIISTMPEFQTQCAALGETGYDSDCYPQAHGIFETIEIVCVMFFTAEYLTRLFLAGFMRTELADRDRTQLLNWMCAEEVIEFPTFFQRVMSFALDASNVIDLLAILPWYLTAMFSFTNSGFRDNALLKVVRLTRVFRAFRLGRRFEAVVIIARSLKTSQRALFVLVLNLLLGMVIFGALMYFAEQGTWDADSQAYIRVVDEEWSNETFEWKPIYFRSPFESIPACFWWAIVTATTVGYGDVHTPTTPPGKIVAAVAMVWSLCVLALPIGVIGSNFSDVWEEYDREKTEEEISHRQQEIMVRQSIAWGDPLMLAKMVLIEVWHTTGLSSGEHADTSRCEFLGELECKLEIDPWEPTHHKVVGAPLTPNWNKAKRRVTGMVAFEYSWTPDRKGDTSESCSDDEILVRGTLELCRFRATGLLNIDYKRQVSRTPFA